MKNCFKDGNIRKVEKHCSRMYPTALVCRESENELHYTLKHINVYLLLTNLISVIQ